MAASRGIHFFRTYFNVVIGTAALLPTLMRTTAAPAPSTNDLWDVSQGAVITAHSTMLSCGSSPGPSYDARDIFGGSFSVGCRDGIKPNNVMFADFHPDGYVDFVEWATPVLVTIRSFNLWANGDGSLETREMASFRLLAKSPGSSSYDLVLYTFTPTHPYTYLSSVGPLLISTQIAPTTAREFRAEFVSRNVRGLLEGPRIVELDGFGEVASPAFTVQTVVGFGLAGDSSIVGTRAAFNQPNGGCVDTQGSVWVADNNNHRVKKVTPDGLVVFVAGTGVAGFADGPAQSAQFHNPIGVCVDSKSNAYVADAVNHRIRRISPAGEVSTVAGTGNPGYVSGPQTTARFNMPNDLVLDSAGNLYVTEFQNNTVRKVTPAGVVSTWAGNGTVGSQNGTGAAARFNQPGGIAIDSSGNLYVTEWGGHRIRKITPQQVVTTVAGSGTPGLLDGQGTAARFQNPDGIVIGTDGNIYIADNGNHAIRRLESGGYVGTIAGTGAPGLVDGPGSKAQFANPTGIGWNKDGTLFVTDGSNHALRQIVRGSTNNAGVVLRRLPGWYAVGQEVSVILEAHPFADIVSYAVEEQVPAGWVFVSANEGGVFDSANNKIKFGPFFDNRGRALTYSLKAPSGETGTKQFSGVFSCNGNGLPILGDSIIKAALMHPADLSPADWRVGINELTVYGAAWKKGTAWPVEPKSIPIGYVTRAGALWKSGEAYRYDASVAGGAPLCWVSNGVGLQGTPGNPGHLLRLAAASGPSSAQAEMPLQYLPGQQVSVQIRVQPAAAVIAYAVEDHPPAGWQVTAISDGGAYDTTSGKVKWGPYFDATARTLSYQANPESDVTPMVVFAGVASFDGTEVSVGGARQVMRTESLSFKLISSPAGAGVQFELEWGADWVLQAAAQVMGPWTDLVTTTHSFDVQASGQRAFFRLRWRAR